MPAAEDRVNALLGRKQICLTSLFNSTVPQRIEEIASYVKDQLIEKLRCSQYYYIQLDESTDITNMLQLLMFIIYLDKNSVKEDFLFSKTLSIQTIAKNIFEKLDLFMKSYDID